MQLALVSDIHANLQAWNAVLLDIRSLDVDSILCLGDIVGYGPNPAEVMTSVHSNVEHLVLGNHDAVVCGKLSSDLFNDVAAQVIRWTRGQLNSKAVRFLESLPLTIDCGDFRCSHGDMSDPAAFHYISKAEDAAFSWSKVPGGLFFVGHTHEPAIFILGESGVPRSVEIQDFIVEDDRRYVVNPGSVGQPRDGLALSSYIIYDTESRSVYQRRVPFDIDSYKSAVVHAGIDESVSWFLEYDPRNNVELARDITDFSPPSEECDKAAGVIELQELDLLRTDAKRWRRSFAAALASMLVLVSAAGCLLISNATKRKVIPAGGGVQSSGSGMLVSLKLDEAPFLPLSDFDIELGNRRQQKPEIVQESDGPVLSISSNRKTPVILISRPIPSKAGDRLSLEALIRKSSDFEGSAVAFISIYREIGGRAQITERFMVKEPNLVRRNGFMLAKQTFELPADTTHVSLGLSAEYTGSIAIADLNLSLRE